MQVITDKVVTENFTMDYFTFGEGETPLVIIPGLSVRSVMLSANSVAGTFKSMRNDFTVFVFDRKRDIEPGYTVYDMAEDTARAMEILGIENACLFGTSMGGMMSLCISINHPHLVKKLVLGSSASRMNSISDNIFAQWINYAEKKDIENLNSCIVDNVYSKEFLKTAREILLLFANNITEKECQRFLYQAKGVPGFDVFDRLREIKCPVLVLGAENDKVLSAQASRDMAKELGCEIYMYDKKYGHAVYDEAPDYIDRIKTFFTKQ